MSGSYSQGTPARVLKSSPNSTKQGPMKATIPISSIVKNSSSLTKNISPTLSPPSSCWKIRMSPEHSGQRSPGSSTYKAKPKVPGSCGSEDTAIRRTASLDTIYLKGHWPRDSFYWYAGSLQVDKATQTDEADWADVRKMQFIPENGDDKLEKMLIRQRLQRSSKDSNSRHPSTPTNAAVVADHTLNTTTQTTAMYILSPTLKANPMVIPARSLSKPTMRSSIEGLNQEIEKLVLKSSSSGGLHCMERSDDFDKFCQAPPEGRRAPLADMFRSTMSKSVNTQTPGELPHSCHSSDPPSRGSTSSLVSGHLDVSSSEAGGSQGSSPDQEGSKLGTSPRINRFLAREPPDGCERVHLRSSDERKSITLGQGPQPCSTFQLKPSLGSAFKIMQPNLQPSRNHDTPPLVPQHQDSN